MIKKKTDIKDKTKNSSLIQEETITKKSTTNISPETNKTSKKSFVEDDEEDTNEAEMIFSDRFDVVAPQSSQELNKVLNLVKDIILPKFIFVPSKKKQTCTKSEKSTCLFTIIGAISKKEKYNPYATLLKLARDGFKDDETLVINLYDSVEETKNPIMQLQLNQLRVAAIDFGDLSIKRDKSSFREIKVEFDYEYITINQQTL